MTREQDAADFTLDVEPPDRYLQRIHANIRKDQARVANRVALILVGAVVLSLPLYLVVDCIFLWRGSPAAEKIQPIFDRWYTIVSPLAGTAIGAYYVASS